jgi:monoamine oxidase
MHRKLFIKNTVTSLVGSTLLPPFVGSCTKPDDALVANAAKTKVIIIGAGIAGLAAANILKAKGLDVTVLEANNYIGGRIKTNTTVGFDVDEGAAWIHGPNNNPITAIAKNAGCTLFETNDDSITIFNGNGVAYSTNTIDSSYAAYEQALQNIQQKGSIQTSFKTVFEQQYPQHINNPLWLYMLSAYLEFDTGADIANLSSKEFDDDDNFNGADVIVANGYHKITHHLTKGILIKTEKKVTAINYANNEIDVMVNTEKYTGNYVIVTVPLSILKNNAIQFTPALPSSKLQAINSLQMGTVNKFVLVFPSIFWNNNLHYIGYTPMVKGKFNYFLNMYKFTGQNALCTFAFGNFAMQTESYTDSQLIAEIMSHLKAIYGNNIPNPTQFFRTKWSKEANIQGAYSFATVGATTASFDTLATAVQNKLFFAGEHTHKQYRGTVHGAYLSGVREAEKILALL